MNIIMRTVPNKHQRYDTLGDWFRTGELDTILVSNMNNPDYEFLVGIHELVEMYLCQKRGITEEKVTKFDKKFETKRKKGNWDEPGDDPKAPYRDEHCIATGVERLIAGILGISWKEYEDYQKSMN